MTFSAYDVVLRPAVAPRSLRVQGTVATVVDSAVGSRADQATTRVAGPSPRPEPIGAGPAV